ncbi:DUF6311 domain-containing protein [Candidatus Pelagibacter sp.]|uniref:DUF6311 domain-containing protein n=1 Tax=Candidatus Pelagibacter sp. TaxID=2024849 RepID=UPI003F83C193
MKKNYLLISQIIFISISIIFWLFLLGPQYINPSNQDWLYNGDLSIYQIGWKFFRNDIWRFPLGLNPNYGIYNGGSIVFSDSIPLLAFIFKLFESLIPDTFQYFSFWIFICIYLQIYLSYKIIFNYSQNFYYSLISSFFFLTSTIFLHRSGIHLSLMGHWLILLYFLINISKTINFKDNKKKILILFSSLIHFYFTIILIIIYFIETIFKLKFDVKIIFKFFINNLILLIALFLLMYVIGYFSIRIDDGIGGGYGFYNFNLSSFFNPLGFNNITSFSWSYFFKDIEFHNSNNEGFSYLGISGLLFFVLCLDNFRTGNYEVIFNRKVSISIFVFLTLLATSNNINFGEYNLFNIDLNKYIYLLLSSVRASGRLIWPVFYIIFLSGILYIYFTQGKKKANIIISILFILQIIDLMPGLKNYKLGRQYTTLNEQFVENKDWIGLSNKFHILRNLNPKNQSELYFNLAKHIMTENYHKTDISYLARINRQTLEKIRENQIKKFNSKDLEIFKNTLYVTKNESLVKNLKLIYKNELNIYFMDDIWLISTLDDQALTKYVYKDQLYNYFKINEINEIFENFENKKNNPFGLGWEFDKKNKKFASVGLSSTLIFQIDKNLCKRNINLQFDFDKYFENQDNLKEIKVIINNLIEKNIFLNDEPYFNVELFKNCSENNTVKLDFYYNNPISKYELRSGLNRKKRAIIINSIQVK